MPTNKSLKTTITSVPESEGVENENMEADAIETTPPAAVVPAKPKGSVLDWFIRLVKGIIIGIGFITPGLSGGALAVVLKIYEPLMKFLGNITKKFWKNLLFFIPVGIGLAIGVVLFSEFVDWILAVITTRASGCSSASSLVPSHRSTKLPARKAGKDTIGWSWWSSPQACSF